MSQFVNKTTEKSQSNTKSTFKLEWWLKTGLFLFVFVLYGSSSSFEYTLDDDIFYLKHASAQEGLASIGDMFSKGSMEMFDGRKGLQPYRPITLVSFGLEKDLFDNDASKSHQINMLLYGFIMLVLYSLMRRLFPQLHILLAFLFVLLFAAHPIHTEVVASVKSRDELLAALFGFMAWLYILPKADEKSSVTNTVISLFCFVLALFSKESAITFLIIIPLSLFMLRGMKLIHVIKMSIPYVLLSAVFLTIRHLVIGYPRSDSPNLILENVLHGTNGINEAIATRLEILYYYFELLIKPWPLSWDYSFNQIPIMNLSNALPWLSILIHLVLIVLAIYFFRKKPVFSFSILFYLIMSLPTNNIFFINGSTVAERFLFVPSFGFVLALFFAVLAIFKLNETTFTGERKTMFYGVVAVLLVTYSVITWMRLPDWETNVSLFESGVEASPNSSRAHYGMASILMKLGDGTQDASQKNNYYKQAIPYFEKSIQILPDNTESQYNLGLLYFRMGNMDKSLQYYQQAIQTNPKYIFAMNNIGLIYEQKRNIDSSLRYYQMAYDVDSSKLQSKKALSGMLCNKGLMLNGEGKGEEGYEMYKKAMQIDNSNEMVLNNIASYFTSQHKFDSALVYLSKAYQLNATNVNVLENLGVVNFLAGKHKEAIDYAQKSLRLNANSRKSIGVLVDANQALGNVAEAAKYRAQLQQLKL